MDEEVGPDRHEAFVGQWAQVFPWVALWGPRGTAMDTVAA